MKGNICPKDCVPCIDDLCRGSGVCAVNGQELIERCHECGGLVSEFIDSCSCEPWSQDDEDDDLTGFDYTGGGR